MREVALCTGGTASTGLGESGLETSMELGLVVGGGIVGLYLGRGNPGGGGGRLVE